MGQKGRGKPFGQLVAEAPVVVDGSGASLNRRSKPSFHEWKLFMASFVLIVLKSQSVGRSDSAVVLMQFF